MKQLTLTVLLSWISLPLFALTTDGSGDSHKMKTLFQCGVGTERNFNGWIINGLSAEAYTHFEKDHIEFFQYKPGNYSIGCIKKIDEMIGYSDLLLKVDLEAIENCVVNTTTAYLSPDGKEWTALNTDVRNGARSHSEKMEFLFIKLLVDVTFFNEARLKLNKVVVYGDYNLEKKLLSSKKQASITDIRSGPAANQIYEEFSIFSFEKKVNVETQNEKVYNFLLINLLGQIVLKEKSQGSKRFETDVPDGIYFVTIFQNDKLITTKKIVL